MPYVAEKPNLAPPTDELRRTIPGWGVDLDPSLRPAVPKERYVAGSTGAHWYFPERQLAHYPRERSTEHRMLTPVFGTSCPPRGVSGMIRRYAYAKYSEGQSAHWLLLMLADRIDVAEHRVTDALRGKPDNPIREMGLKSEITRHGIRSRFGHHRADLVHQPIDALLYAGTTVAIAAGVVALAGGLARAGGRRR